VNGGCIPCPGGEAWRAALIAVAVVAVGLLAGLVLSSYTEEGQLGLRKVAAFTRAVQHLSWVLAVQAPWGSDGLLHVKELAERAAVSFKPPAPGCWVEGGDGWDGRADIIGTLLAALAALAFFFMAPMCLVKLLRAQLGLRARAYLKQAEALRFDEASRVQLEHLLLKPLNQLRFVSARTLRFFVLVFPLAAPSVLEPLLAALRSCVGDNKGRELAIGISCDAPNRVTQAAAGALAAAFVVVPSVLILALVQTSAAGWGACLRRCCCCERVGVKRTLSAPKYAAASGSTLGELNPARMRTKAHHPSGAFMLAYREHAPWWEAVLYARNCAVVVALTLGASWPAAAAGVCLALMLFYCACVWVLRPFYPVPAILLGGLRVHDAGGSAEVALSLLSACAFGCALPAGFMGEEAAASPLGWVVVALHVAAMLAICNMRDPRSLAAKVTFSLRPSMRGTKIHTAEGVSSAESDAYAARFAWPAHIVGPELQSHFEALMLHRAAIVRLARGQITSAIADSIVIELHKFRTRALALAAALSDLRHMIKQSVAVEEAVLLEALEQLKAAEYALAGYCAPVAVSAIEDALAASLARFEADLAAAKAAFDAAVAAGDGAGAAVRRAELPALYDALQAQLEDVEDSALFRADGGQKECVVLASKVRAKKGKRGQQVASRGFGCRALATTA
jgi:hypothetical protein